MLVHAPNDWDVNAAGRKHQALGTLSEWTPYFLLEVTDSLG